LVSLVGVLSVCKGVVHRFIPLTFLQFLNLKGDAWVVGVYLDNSDHSLIYCAPCDTPALALVHYRLRVQVT
jgi:hypothetical protein